MSAVESVRPQPSVRDLLELRETADGAFAGVSASGPRGHLFGGQLIAQAVAAASRSVPQQRPAHSLHAYFVRAGDPDLEVVYRVERIRDGRSFSVRGVRAMQGERTLLTAQLSFQDLDTGVEHAPARVTGFPDPEDFDHFPHAGEEALAHRVLLEIKRVPPRLDPRGPDAGQALWLRIPEALDGGVHQRRAAVALASDVALLEPVVLRHDVAYGTEDLRSASLDHALWWLEDVSPTDWMLVVQDTPWAGHARGIARASVHTRDGSLVALAQQEGVVRVARPLHPPAQEEAL